jgi:hypothetical protein
MKLTSKVKLPKPTSVVKIFRNGALAAVTTNLITAAGLATIMLRVSGNYIAPNGGRVSNLLFGSGSTPITFETTTLSNVITMSSLSGTATTAITNFIPTEEGVTSDISLYYTSPVLADDVILTQLAITPNGSNLTVQYGLTLDTPLEFFAGDVITVAYSIRIPLVSLITTPLVIGSGTYEGTPYTIYGSFNEYNPATDIMYFKWPAITNDAEIRTGSRPRFYVNSVLLPENSGMYKSSQTVNGNEYSMLIHARILSTIPGDISINRFEFGHDNVSGFGYTIRIDFDSPVIKSSTELFDLEVELNIVWE